MGVDAPFRRACDERAAGDAAADRGQVTHGGSFDGCRREDVASDALVGQSLADLEASLRDQAAAGTVISSVHRRHRTIEFKKFLTKIDHEVPADLDVHMVCDNYGTQVPGDHQVAGRPLTLPRPLDADLLRAGSTRSSGSSPS